MSTPAILEGALLAQAAGLAGHYQRGKRAFEPCWSTSPPEIADELRRDYRDGYNIGFRTGDLSKLDGWPVVVLDADIRSDDPAHCETVREAWRELVGDMKPTVKTGGGGAHLYLRYLPDKLPRDQSIVMKQSPDNLGNKPAWTIEFLSSGHAVTLPPSIHPSGKPYERVNGGLAHVEAVPESLLRAVAASQKSRGAGTAEADDAWPDQKPITGELKPVPALDPETLLPEVPRAWIMDEAERMPCPPDFIAAAAVVALGSIIGARCAIKPKTRDNWLIVPNLSGGIVGDPSAKKSPAWGVALKPLDRFDCEGAGSSHGCTGRLRNRESGFRRAQRCHRREHQGSGEKAEQGRSRQHCQGTARMASKPRTRRHCGATRPTTAWWKS
ncbi:MAG: bifunctional DNA primase/polymerase [Methylocella sp.]